MKSLGKELFLVMNELVDAINKLGETSIWDVVSSFGTIVAVGPYYINSGMTEDNLVLVIRFISNQKFLLKNLINLIK